MNQVVTANRLTDGVVVFLGGGLAWVECLAEAEVFTATDTVSDAMKAAQRDEAANVVLDIYAVDVTRRHGAWAPVKLREAIRAQGPTVHPEHGKPLGHSKHG